MTGGIKEGDILILNLYAVRADRLRDATCLTRGNVGMADRVKQRGLTVVNVTHNTYDGRSRLELICGILVLVEELLLDRYDDLLRDRYAEFERNQLCGVVINGLIDRSHLSEQHQLLHDLNCRYVQTGCELTNNDRLGKRDRFRGLNNDGLLLLDLRTVILLRYLRTGPLILLLQLLVCRTVLADRIGHEVIQSLVILRKVDLYRTGIDHTGRSLLLLIASLRGLSANDRLRLEFFTRSARDRASLIIVAVAAVLIKALRTVARSRASHRTVAKLCRTVSGLTAHRSVALLSAALTETTCGILTGTCVTTVSLSILRTETRSAVRNVASVLRCTRLYGILLCGSSCHNAGARLILGLRTGGLCRCGRVCPPRIHLGLALFNLRSRLDLLSLLDLFCLLGLCGLLHSGFLFCLYRLCGCRLLNLRSFFGLRCLRSLFSLRYFFLRRLLGCCLRRLFCRSRDLHRLFFLLLDGLS